MSLRVKQAIIASLAVLFLVSLVFVQWMEVARKHEEAGLTPAHVSVPTNSRSCVECHEKLSPGIIDHWKGSTHAEKGVGCVECHQAKKDDVDGFNHYGETIATVVTPRDCSRCHKAEYEEFVHSHHAKAGNILASLDNFLAETVEGSRTPFNPHSPTPGMDVNMVNGMASANVGCKQCHGSKVALESIDGGMITVDDLKPDEQGHATNLDAVAKIKKNANGQPLLHSASWPNTGIGRLNLDGSRGSCSACHSRHDFSPRRARQPENCGKCHLGPDHPQKEIYEESKHGVAFRDLREKMNLDATDWVLGEDYTQAPTCATCHMSANTRNGRKVTHDPGERISWTNRPPVSLVMDTDINGQVVKESDSQKRAKLVVNTWQEKRQQMKNVCSHCHTGNYIDAFYKQYDDFVVNYNEKFAKPGQKIMAVLREQKLITDTEFDEEIEWTWFYLWHHEGRRARHGASMMAPDYAHWHGMYEVAERFYQQLIPQAREIAIHAEEQEKVDEANAVRQVIDEILARPEHEWFERVKMQLAFQPKQLQVAKGNAPLFAALTERVEQPTAKSVDSESITQLMARDTALTSIGTEDARTLQAQLLAALAQAEDPRGIQYVRSVFENETERRGDAAYALSLAVLQGPADLDDWRFLVRSLTVVERVQAVSVLQALRRFRQLTTKPTWVRRVVLIGLQLDGEDQQHAISLLEFWTGQQFGGEGKKPIDALAAAQVWFREHYPDEPDPVLPVDPIARRWKFGELRAEFVREDTDAGDVARGLVVFEKANCNKCHRKGEVGEPFGPDLTTLGWRRQQKEILEAILFPSHELDEEYPTVSVITDDGRVLTGMMAVAPADTIVLVQPDGKRQSLPRRGIEEIRPSRTSNMPEDLLESLSLQEIRDLFAFLKAGESSLTPHPARETVSER